GLGRRATCVGRTRRRPARSARALRCRDDSWTLTPDCRLGLQLEVGLARDAHAPAHETEQREPGRDRERVAEAVRALAIVPGLHRLLTLLDRGLGLGLVLLLDGFLDGV